jgi:hypothetical protein
MSPSAPIATDGAGLDYLRFRLIIGNDSRCQGERRRLNLYPSPASGWGPGEPMSAESLAKYPQDSILKKIDFPRGDAETGTSAPWW